MHCRFASQTYSSERILADKAYIKDLFNGQKIRDYLSRAPSDQRIEHESLDADLVSNAVAWRRISIFVDIETPLRTLLRITDGHKPNLSDVCFGFDKAKELSVLAATAAEKKYPVEYSGLTECIGTAIDKRKKDIVTSLCLAAAMVLPKHVYVIDGQVACDPEGGSAALNDVIMRYYKDDVEKQNQAFKVYSDFREKSGVHFGGRNLDHIAKTGTADEFWARASLADRTGPELFRKLVNGYCGQGESERMNKQVKKHRTTVRNRQSHQVTASFMELDTTYKMMYLKEKQVPTNVYMECLRDKVFEMMEEIEEKFLEQQAIQGDNGNVVVNEEDGEDEVNDYALEHVDLGREALVELF